ncbi:MAG TPA: 4'-phosphopantetheinyl transferase superfamily protein [Thermoanaerobaculia bacterium]|nr:4'-phosphopantetheinyl transferase superfamily protein [Thermoanaerobaculia bacterium]
MKRHPIPERNWSGRVAIVSDVDEADLETQLTEHERSMMATLRLARRRNEWAAARIALKQLAIASGVAERAVDCEIERIEGRPALLVCGSPAPLFVSLSHSRGVSAGMVGAQPVGIDLQEVRSISERATRFFLSDEEAAMLASLAIADRMMHLWAAKEAAWKASAIPLSTLRSVAFTLESEGADALRLRYVSAGRSGSIDTLRLDDDFVLAVAEEGSPASQ